jgi:hypothetical protein
MASNAFLISDRSYRGPITESSMGGCFIEDPGVNRGNGFRPLSGSWEPCEVDIHEGVYVDTDDVHEYNLVSPCDRFRGEAAEVSFSIPGSRAGRFWGRSME